MNNHIKLKFVFDSVNIHVEADKDIEYKLKDIYNNNQNKPYQFMTEAMLVAEVDTIGTELK